ncbi:MAG: iron-containing alcohol dehydrogenase [Spongiibacteraceae bacterium]
MQTFAINTCKSIVSGAGALRQLSDICRSHGIQRPMIVTDPGIRQIGLLEKAATILKNDGFTVQSFGDVIADPPESMVIQAVELAKHGAADGIIGLGGGSSLDTAKLVALIAKSDEQLKSLYGVNQARGERLPLILIPTTAGTGSEVTPIAIVTTGETTKMGVVANQLIGDVAVLDAELTLDLPAHITAMTGIDAMVHAVEAYTSVHRKNCYTDMLAREALRLLSINIISATHDGKNIEARQAMLIGSCMAGQAFANAPVAAVHALAYPLGGRYHIAHGLSNALVLPHVLRFNTRMATHAYAELAEIVIPAQQLSLTVSGRCEQLIEYFVNLSRQLKLPQTLAAVGVSEQDLPQLASEAMLQQRLLVNNPRPVTEADARAIYQAAFQ